MTSRRRRARGWSRRSSSTPPAPPPTPPPACAISTRSAPVLEKMAEIGLPLCVHGEVTAAEVDIFDREAVFIDTVLDPIRRATPGLRVVMEHITTSNGVNYVARGRRRHRRHDHHPSPDHQPQRHPRRRHPPALLLPAGGQARRPTGWRCAQAATRGDGQLLPRHRQRPAPDPSQGARLRLRRDLLGHQHAVLPRGSVRAGRGARPARSLHLAQRPGLLPAAGQRRDDHAAPAASRSPTRPRSRPPTARSRSSIPVSRCTGG